jgi:hypothetical protein
MSKINISIVSQAKDIYIKQLVKLVSPCIYQGIYSIYNQSQELCKGNNDLVISLLDHIKDWSDDILTKEVDRIRKSCHFEMLDELVKVIVINYCKILLYPNDINDLVEYLNTRINFKDFIHGCYREIAREIIKNPSLICEKSDAFVKYKKIQNLIENTIITTVEKLIPLKIVLKTYLKKKYDNEVSSVDSKVSEDKNNDIMRMIKMDLDAINSSVISQSEKRKTTVRESEKHTPSSNKSTMSYYAFRKKPQVSEKRTPVEKTMSENKLSIHSNKTGGDKYHTEVAELYSNKRKLI